MLLKNNASSWWLLFHLPMVHVYDLIISHLSCLCKLRMRACCIIVMLYSCKTVAYYSTLILNNRKFELSLCPRMLSDGSNIKSMALIKMMGKMLKRMFQFNEWPSMLNIYHKRWLQIKVKIAKIFLQQNPVTVNENFLTV